MLCVNSENKIFLESMHDSSKYAWLIVAHHHPRGGRLLIFNPKLSLAEFNDYDWATNQVISTYPVLRDVATGGVWGGVTPPQ